MGDNEIILSNGKHLIIEVHGKQHYNNNFYKVINKCTEEEANKILHQSFLSYIPSSLTLIDLVYYFYITHNIYHYFHL